ncbi:Outer membrane chaperone Skp (OmpH) [gut metagenome]|uniref:Outer membrane chaperone Skp (OmpH) n=1 Tax=gut metagenome TaxID=749906 RepID=J9G6J5_9ZZZZ
MKPELREQIHLKLARVKEARERELSVLQEEKNAYIAAAMKPHIEAVQKKLADYAAQQHSDIANKLKSSDAAQEEKLKGAPDALHKALSIMDKEIDKQQAANDELRDRISKDIASISAKLAHEQGYTIVFKRVKVNVNAADITDEVIKQLKNTEDSKK